MSNPWSPRFPRPVVRSASIAFVGLAAYFLADGLHAQGPIPSANINIVRGTSFVDGDPYLQRQNEPSIAVSSRNPCHLLAGSNDYRTVDIPDSTPIPNEQGGPTTAALASPPARDAWVGVFQSTDCGTTWRSTLIPGFPQDDSPAGLASPNNGYGAAADPVVRAGTNGLFYYAGLVFDRVAGGESQIFVARYIDNNNKERGDTIAYVDTSVVAKALPGQFIDKPWLAVDGPRNPSGGEFKDDEDDDDDRPSFGGNNCVINGQRIPAGNIYMAWSQFEGTGDPTPSRIMFARSTDCGRTWQRRAISPEGRTSHAASIAIAPHDGTIYVAWRQLANALTPHAIYLAVSRDRGRTFSPAIQVANGINAFDQQKTPTRFRTTTFPSITADHQNRVYIAWSERGFAKDGNNPVTGRCAHRPGRVEDLRQDLPHGTERTHTLGDRRSERSG